MGGPYGVVGICPISSADAYRYLLETAAEPPRAGQVVTGSDLRDKLGSYGGPLREEAISHLQTSRNVSLRGIEHLLVPDPSYDGRIVLIGDAAHANPPVLAQGAAMGVEDAIVLAEELSGEREGAPGLETSLCRFMRDVTMGIYPRDLKTDHWLDMRWSDARRGSQGE